MNRATSTKQFIQTKFKTMDIPVKFKGTLGKPECSGSWLIYGESFNGKTTFALQLIESLCTVHKAAYLVLEEGLKLTFQDKVRDSGIVGRGSKIVLWHNETLEDIYERLESPRSPRIVFIDSVQYLRANKKSGQEISKFEYIQLLEAFPERLFVFISHAEKGNPKGSLASAIYYGSDICIEVKEFIAYPNKNRCGGSEPYNL